MRFRRKRAALPRLEIHHVRALPSDVVALGVMFEHLLAAFAQHRESDAETFVGRFRAADGLEQQIDRRAAFQRSELRGDVREAARLRRRFARSHQAIERVQNCANRFHRIRGGVYADHRVAAAVEQAFKRGEQDAANIVHRMIGLHTNAQHAALAHGVAATRHVANSRSRQHQIFVAHDFRYGRGYFRNDGALDVLEVRFGGGVVEKAFTKFADGEAFQWLEIFPIEGIQNQAADVVLLRINQRILHNFVERQFGELAFRGHALAFRARRRFRPVDRQTFPRWPWQRFHGDRKTRIAQA